VIGEKKLNRAKEKKKKKKVFFLRLFLIAGKQQ
jgi:hypothetical protein